jgi:hypothetical protein
MSDKPKQRRPDRGAPSKEAPASASPAYTVVASGENVVLVNTTTGQTWAMASDGERPVWQPVAFQAGAPRAPRRGGEAKKPEGG